MKPVYTFWIDLFSGAGGTTSGIHHLSKTAYVKVVACVNHDLNAIESHKLNWPDCLHLIEDVRDYNVVVVLRRLVEQLRRDYPGCYINLWASAECTNFSNAKGGMPRDADSRTLAHAINNYVDELKPDYVYIENVKEFMSWGPLGLDNKPISKNKGEDYLNWVSIIKGMGYGYDSRILNAADFGACQSRERFFGIFNARGISTTLLSKERKEWAEMYPKEGLPIKWPDATHTKFPDKYPHLKPRRPVREVLDLYDEGESIFNRKKPYCENSLKRLYAGLVKFVANGDESFLIRYNGGNPEEKAKSIDKSIGTIKTSNRYVIAKTVFLSKQYSGNDGSKNIPIDGACGTITTKDHHYVCTTEFMTTYNGNSVITSIDDPCPTVPTHDRFNKIKPVFLIDYQYKSNAHSIEEPSPTLLTKDKFAPVTVQFFDQQYGNSKPASIDVPSGTITVNPKFNLVTTQKSHFLLNPQYGDKGRKIDDPCFTLIARMDKKPPYLVQTESGAIGILVYDTDSEMTVKIKRFMAAFGIADIKMRMLKIPELLQIQGFPRDYKLKGTLTEQKKYIGNAVETHVAMALAGANHDAIMSMERIAV
jgi:DNA (cytosine-5)-methyltransferase 1